MDSQAFAITLKSFLKTYWLPLAFACIGLTFFVWGMMQYFGGQKPEPVVFETPDVASVSAARSGGEVTFDVEGAVVAPGVYNLPTGSRLQDALVAAGGLSQNADRTWVAQSINLAAKVTDGGKLYIKAEGESNSGITPLRQGSEGQAGNTVLGTQTNTININSASVSELDTLSGIGPVTAEKIIGGRPYNDINELVSKKIVTAKVFEKIKERIVAQ